jgi:hypothetical protein
MSSAPDRVISIELIARRLLGEPNQQSANELRYGSKGSLSIDLRKNTFYDHEAGQGGGVYDLVRREIGGGDPREWLRAEGLIEARLGGSSDHHLVTFNYKDESGALLFQVCRTSGKKFFQRRPNGGGWINNLKGVRRVLYRLPELIAGTSKVFIAEGEKHVDALRKLGLRATCNPGGAGKWCSEYNEPLRGADVVILPDNDGPGHKHGQDIALALHGVAATVCVLELPGLGAKGDVINWLEAGGTLQELERLAGEAPEWHPPAGAADADQRRVRRRLRPARLSDRRLSPEEICIFDDRPHRRRQDLRGAPHRRARGARPNH